MPVVDVCLSPELIHLYSLEGKIVVVVDVFRATSCMSTAFAHGIKEIIPVATIKECAALQATGLKAGAERDAKKVEGFELDNSPFTYMDPSLAGTTIAVTTTNGTLAITKSMAADQILVGSFLNIGAICNYLKAQQKDVLIHCAGWKGKPNLEDTLFAGAVAAMLEDFSVADDSALMAKNLYLLHKDSLMEAVGHSAHVKRLANLGIQKDIAFCLEHSKYTAIPVWQGDRLVQLN
jgi:2-phosphosulfolactate phosphatase